VCFIGCLRICRTSSLRKRKKQVAIRYSPNCWSQSDVLGIYGSPGVCTVRAESLSGKTIYDVKYSIGEDGFRITPGGDSRYQRINFFGDSFTFGVGLNDNETLPYFIQQRMREISVKNWDFPAYGAHQTVAILESDRDTKGAINFFLTAPWFAPRSSCKPLITGGSPKYEIQSNGAVVRVGRCDRGDQFGVFRKILAHSRLYLAAEEIWRDSTSDADFELYFAIVKRVGEISRQRGQKFIIGFAKAEEQFFKGVITQTKKSLGS
jgi:hypothetical protein